MTEQNLEAVLAALTDRKAENIKALHVAEVSPVTDYFVLATGRSIPQMNAMTDAVEEVMGSPRREGRAEGGWILLDYGDIVVHIFSPEMREFYSLDHTWRDVSVRTYPGQA